VEGRLEAVIPAELKSLPNFIFFLIWKGRVPLFQESTHSGSVLSGGPIQVTKASLGSPFRPELSSLNVGENRLHKDG
jgi:hypothetical protein